MMILGNRHLMFGAAFAVLAAAGIPSAAAENLDVRLDKAEVLRLAAPAAVIVVGNPAIADVTVENPLLLFVIGRAPGETNLLILDEGGDLVADYELIVVAERQRHVTVNRSTIQLSTYSCDPRCIEVLNPSEVERVRQFAAAPEEEEEAGAGAVEAPAAEPEAAAGDEG
jgi:Flp pilus assembly secretin CpaC